MEKKLHLMSVYVIVIDKSRVGIKIKNHTVVEVMHEIFYVYLRLPDGCGIG